MIDVSKLTRGATVAYSARGRDQVFEYVGKEMVVRKDGADAQVIKWVSKCLICGGSYSFTSSTKWLAPIRTCQEHRRGLRKDGTNPRALGDNPRARRAAK